MRRPAGSRDEGVTVADVSGLPRGASTASRVRQDFARTLTAACPRELGREIAVTGSTARDVADRFSDIELNFWVEALPHVGGCLAWLRAAGATTEPLEDEAFQDGAFSTKSWYDGVFVEATWQTRAALEAELGTILTGATVDHWRLTKARHVAHAVPVWEGPWLAGWRDRLAD